MKIISNSQTLHAAGLTFVQYENKEESIAVAESICDASIPDIILLEDGFVCKTTEVFEIREQLEELCGLVGED